jgi:hypothetical protein
VGLRTRVYIIERSSVRVAQSILSSPSSTLPAVLRASIYAHFALRRPVRDGDVDVDAGAVRALRARIRAELHCAVYMGGTCRHTPARANLLRSLQNTTSHYTREERIALAQGAIDVYLQDDFFGPGTMQSYAALANCERRTRSRSLLQLTPGRA